MKSSAISKTQIGWLLAFGLFCFGMSPILVRLAKDAGEVQGVTLAVWRTGIAVLLLLPFAIKQRVDKTFFALSRKEKSLIAIAGVILGLHFITFINAFYFASVASTAVIVTMSPIILAVLGFVVLKERLTRLVTLGILLGFLGATLIGWGETSNDAFPYASLGITFAVIAVVAVSVYLLIGRVARQGVSWLAYVFPLYTICAFVILLFAVFASFPLIPPNGMVVFYCLLMAIGPQIIGHGSFNYAVKFFPAAVLGLLGLVEPIFAGFVAYLIWGEIPSLITVFGMTLTVFAIALAIMPKRTS